MGLRERGRRLAGDEAGATLMLVLGVLSLASLLLTALLAFVTAYVHDGAAFQSRVDRVQKHRDAVDYAFNAIRNDNTVGREGTSSTWTMNGVTVTCTGASGSGVVQNSGRTDRTVTCTTPEISAQMRYFDRGGSGSGVLSELLWFKLLR